MSMDASQIKKFFDFIKERHAIYIRRQRGDSWPWTDDPILQTYKFTNIFRELDTGTVWLRENIREPYADDPDLFFNVAAYRRYNLIRTAEALGYIDQYDYIVHTEYMMSYKAAGNPVFTSAYMTCGGITDPDTGWQPKTKVEQIFGIAFRILWEKRHELAPTPSDNLESAWGKLNSRCPAYGPFIAYEVVTDLRWTRYLENANDIMTWANAGPGAMRGIQRIMGLQVAWVNGVAAPAEVRKHYPNRAGYLEYMRHLLKLSEGNLPKWMPQLEMRDIEHSLCEWDKYMRVSLGQGRPRQKFIPPIMR